MESTTDAGARALEQYGSRGRTLATGGTDVLSPSAAALAVFGTGTAPGTKEPVALPTPDSGSPYSGQPRGAPLGQREETVARPSAGLTFTDVNPRTDPIFLKRIETWAGDVAAYLGRQMSQTGLAGQVVLSAREHEAIFGEIIHPQGLALSPYRLEDTFRALGEMAANPVAYIGGFPGFAGRMAGRMTLDGVGTRLLHKMASNAVKVAEGYLKAGDAIENAVARAGDAAVRAAGLAPPLPGRVLPRPNWKGGDTGVAKARALAVKAEQMRPPYEVGP